MSENKPLPAQNEGRVKLGACFDRLSVSSRVMTSRAVVSDKVKPLVTPIYHSSTYVFQSVEDCSAPNHGGNHLYRRTGNPTQETAETILCELERGAATLMYSSGLAAVNAVFLQFLSAQDHMVCQRPLYSGSYAFINDTLRRFDVRVSWVDADENDFTHKVAQAIQHNTKLIYVETPCNPILSIVDVERLCELGRDKGVLTVVDGTFASPYLQQPIVLGADIVLHSCTKYIGGHSDLIGGCVTTRTIDLWTQLKLQQMTTGSALSVVDASLVTRGLKTLPLRMKRISDTAMEVAIYLQTHSKVTGLWYPGLPSHPGHSVARKQMLHFGGMIAFDVGTWQRAVNLVQNVKLITLAVSLGGVESLIEHPASMTHGQWMTRVDGDSHALSLITPGLIRLSVGLEEGADLIEDLAEALQAV